MTEHNPMDPPELDELTGDAEVIELDWEYDWVGLWVRADGFGDGVFIVVPSIADGYDELAVTALLAGDGAVIQVRLSHMYDIGVGGYQAESVEILDGGAPITFGNT